jgi:dTDP-4-dehydrorhamnose 3,5-epimerase
MGRPFRDGGAGDTDLRVKFTSTEIPGVVEIESEPHHDPRGFFARIYCPEEFASAGIQFISTQINLSRNMQKHTLRGMHWRDAPHAEAKIVRVTSGAIYDVVVDIRPESPGRCRWIARRLDAISGNALFIPEGCAHGFLTLEENTDVLYQMSRPHVAGPSRGLRFDDPGIAITWPAEPKVISEADLAWPSPWRG